MKEEPCSPSTSHEADGDDASKLRLPPQLCDVCGEPARGYHYGVAACNGCRSFFRRSILGQRRYLCSAGGQCTLVKGAHWRCRACRFDACIRAGMDPLAIESETVSSNTLVSELTKRRRSSEDQGEEAVSPKVSVCLPSTQAEKETRRLGGLLLVESKVAFMRKSTFSAAKYLSESLAKVILSHSALGKTHKYEIVTDWDAYPNRGVFAESSVKQKIMDFTRRNWLHFDLTLAVEYTKTFNFFHDLNVTDKIAILRGTCLQSFLVTQAFESMGRKSDQLEQPDGKILIKSMRERGSPMADALEQLSMGPILRIRPSKEEYVLLKAIMLANAASSGLSDKGRELVKTEQNAYAHTLLEVCTREYGNQAGALRFATIIAVVDGFLRCAQRHKDWHVVIKALRHSGKRVRCIPMETPLVDELME